MHAPPPPARRSTATRLARLLLWLAALGLLALAALWAWHQPFLERPRTLWELSRLPPPASLPVPVQGVAAGRIADTFGAPRGADREHAGVDIFAARGTPVVSTTRGVVVAIRERGLGGRQVWVYGPAGEHHYYAHLDNWAPALAEGDVVQPGTVLGTVGNTGNARTTPPHLHYGIYGRDGAVDPLPRMRTAR
ncbi:peptidase [Pseudoxanthomonas suwonensis]|uniref:Peptidase n=1 Tax=Pseudoxanthomonas suwonensis TaxID=314722 RepID=A0A0E3Z2A4_9GAMM|nr:M23 family metallopeptidase [Pseudoxanthomonas suwonensis]AKC87648.1 peptidase [Pseudoxanthomonas suwonensis]